MEIIEITGKHRELPKTTGIHWNSPKKGPRGAPWVGQGPKTLMTRVCFQLPANSARNARKSMEIIDLKNHQIWQAPETKDDRSRPLFGVVRANEVCDYRQTMFPSDCEQ